MKLRWLAPAALLLLLALTPLAAVEVSGTAYADQMMMEDAGIRLLCNVHFEVRWKVWTFMGEPVDEETVAWVLPSEARFELTDEFRKAYPFPTDRINFASQFSGLTVPKEVMQKVRVVDLLFWGFCNTYGTVFVSTPVGLKMDPGVLSKPFVSSSGYASLGFAELHKLPAATMQSYFSFTVPGSPDWGKLFLDRSLSKSLTAVEAKKVMAKTDLSFGAVAQGGDSSVEIIKVRYDLSPVRDWLLGLEDKALAQWEQETAKKDADLATKEAARKAAEAKDFWGTPANADSTADKATRQNVADARNGLAAARRTLSVSRSTHEQAVQQIDALIAAKRQELSLRPKPGEGPTGALVTFKENGNLGLKDSTGKIFLTAQYSEITPLKYTQLIRIRSAASLLCGLVDTKGRIIVPCTYRFIDDFSEGLAPVIDATTGKYGSIDTSGAIVIPCTFGWLDDFSDGYASFYAVDPLDSHNTFTYAQARDPRNWNIYGVIDKTGKVVIQPQFEYPLKFNSGGAKDVFRVTSVGEPYGLNYQDRYKAYFWNHEVGWETFDINGRGERVSDIKTGTSEHKAVSVSMPH